MNRPLWTALLLLLSARGFGASSASEALQEREQSLKDGYKTLGSFFSGVFQKSAGFNSGSNAFIPAAAKKRLRFNAGLTGGAAFTPIDKSAATRGLDASRNQGLLKQIEGFPSVLPVPQGGLNAHLGVPSFLFFESADLGLRLSGLNSSQPAMGVELGGLGVELRGNLFEAGLVWPLTLTLGLSWDSFKGRILLSQSAQLNDSSSVSGYTATGNVTQEALFSMENNAYALKAVASRSFLFATPYAGLAAQVNSGGASSRFTQKGTVTMTGAPADTASSSGEVTHTVSSPVEALDVRLGAGLQLDLAFVYLALGGEYGVISGGQGAHLHLGLQF